MLLRVKYDASSVENERYNATIKNESYKVVESERYNVAENKNYKSTENKKYVVAENMSPPLIIF